MFHPRSTDPVDPQALAKNIHIDTDILAGHVNLALPGTLFEWGGCPAGGCGGRRVVDFRHPAGRAAWVNGMVAAVRAGLDGVFIDGFRGDVGAGKMGVPGGAGFNASGNAAWGAGGRASCVRPTPPTG